MEARMLKLQRSSGIFVPAFFAPPAKIKPFTPFGYACAACFNWILGTHLNPLIH
jgi:hypothetical protein